MTPHPQAARQEARRSEAAGGISSGQGHRPRGRVRTAARQGRHRGRRAGPGIMVRLIWACLLGVLSATALAQDDWLRDSWREVIAASAFQEPLAVASEERPHSVSGSVHARLDHPFGELAEALGSPAAWCQVFFLHLNVKGCFQDPAGDEAALTLYVGRRHYEPLADAERLDLRWRMIAAGPTYLEMVLEGDRGPYGTRAFRLQLRAVPDLDGQSLVQLRYSLVYGMTARLALRGYFAFGGRDRVGFSEAPDEDSAGLVGGMRGMIERNVMRFYLALVAHLEARALPEAERLEASLSRWFDLTERYPEQLREIERGAYLEMKRRELARQRQGEGG
ncbi:hypothetical protein [Halomonas sp. BM-2019]|uniref:hypothetical protein n=1 Tax=Halomonas sp. BM-2019 TaxID=2811227 RepID=UPI001B3C2A3D|nr:MAG: hypothetical protein J5F18_19300 [Halomonas sp. BM-2019]